MLAETMAGPMADLMRPVYVALGTAPSAIPGPLQWGLFFSGVQGLLDYYLPTWATGPWPGFALGVGAVALPALPGILDQMERRRNRGHLRIVPPAPVSTRPAPPAGPTEARRSAPGAARLETVAEAHRPVCGSPKPGDPLYTCVRDPGHNDRMRPDSLHTTGGDPAFTWE